MWLVSETQTTNRYSVCITCCNDNFLIHLKLQKEQIQRQEEQSRYRQKDFVADARISLEGTYKLGNQLH